MLIKLQGLRLLLFVRSWGLGPFLDNIKKPLNNRGAKQLRAVLGLLWTHLLDGAGWEASWCSPMTSFLQQPSLPQPHRNIHTCIGSETSLFQTPPQWSSPMVLTSISLFIIHKSIPFHSTQACLSRNLHTVFILPGKGLTPRIVFISAKEETFIFKCLNWVDWILLFICVAILKMSSYLCLPENKGG